MSDGKQPEALRINNRKVVLDTLKQTEKTTIATLSKDLGLSKTTLAKIIKHFLNQQIILSSGKEASTAEGGKKAEAYRFNESSAYTICLVIYEKFILAALSDARSDIFYKEKIHLTPNENIHKVIEIMAGFIAQWQNPANLPHPRKRSILAGIAIAGTGVINTDEGVCFTASRFHSWPVNVSIKDLIEKKIELKAPFFIDNYNRFFSYAEMSLRKQPKENCLVDLVTSYGGLGAGIIIDGKIHRGARYLSGEIGHLCLDPNQEETCYCGGRGCFETLVSSSRILHQAAIEQPSHKDSAVYNTEGPISLRAIFTASDGGDSRARELLDQVIKWFAIGIHNINLIYNPDVLIISGDYSRAGTYFKKSLADLMEHQALLRMSKELPIEYSQLDDDGAILGAAGFILNDYFENRFEY